MEQPQTIITAIKPTQRDANRATIRVGVRGKAGKVVATLNQRRINELGLEVGLAWDEALAGRVADTAAVDKALRQAMNRLSRRPMSRRNLDRKLRDLEHPEPVRRQVLERLDELGLMDDEALGRALIRDAQLRKPAGPAFLKKKLFDKGLDHALIDKLVAEATSDDDQQRDAALKLARSKAGAGSMARLDPQARHRRLYGQLARRGFTPDIIRDVMEQLRAEENADGLDVE
jgi:regulatory protein